MIACEKQSALGETMIVKVFLTVLVAAAVLLLGGLGLRKIRRRQVSQALAINAPNGIAEQLVVRLGGTQQWIQIRGEDRGNPVLLILHGGPGWPNAVFTLPLRPWEKHFTLVQWDHRGAGKTLGRSGKPDTSEMTFSRRVSDAVELAEFLCKYLHKDRLILLAESMGVLTGLPLVKLRPDLFSAIVATDLYVDVAQNELVKWQMTLERLRLEGSRKGLAALEKIDADPAGWDLRTWNTNMAWAFKTNQPTPNIDRKLLLPLVISSPIYTLHEIYRLFAGFRRSTADLFDEMIAFDARKLGSNFDVPFFLFQGEDDVITVTRLAVEYFNEIKAPVKSLALIKGAGHFAAFTQPELFLTELITHVHPLANPPVSLEQELLQETA